MTNEADKRRNGGAWTTILRGEESDGGSPPMTEPPLRLVLLTQMDLYPQARLEVARSADLPRVKPLGPLARWLCRRWPRLMSRGRRLTKCDGRSFLTAPGRAVHPDPFGGYYSAPQPLLPPEAAAALRQRYVELIDAALLEGDETRARRLVDEHRREYQREIITRLRRIV